MAGLESCALGPTLETERLLLRPPSVQDFEGRAALMADSAHVRDIGGAQPRAVAWRGLMGMIGSRAANGFAMFSVIEKASGRWIGRVAPCSPEGWPGTEVGWTLVRDAAGRGYAQEAAVATIDRAFDRLDWADVIHIIDPDNASSIRLAKRLGSRHVRTGCKLPEPYHELRVEVWGQTRHEWPARRRAAA